MTKKERVFATVRREHLDYLPSQITLADRTRDKELHAALKLPAAQTMDEYLENHIIISLVKQDYPLFYRNDTKLMKELGYGREYRYAHDEPDAYAAGENYFPEGMPEVNWYQPTPRGLEGRISEKLAYLRELDRKAKKQ